MYDLQILQKAREDMQKSADWYNEQQFGLGQRFYLEVLRTFRLIQTNPYTRRKIFQKVQICKCQCVSFYHCFQDKEATDYC